MEPQKRRSIRKCWLWLLWLFLGCMGLSIAMVIVEASAKRYNDQDFRLNFMKKVKALHFQITAEQTGWLDVQDLPLMTRLSLSHFTTKPHIDMVVHLVNDGDGTDTFLLEDTQSSIQYEIDVYSKDHQVLAVAIHYPSGHLEEGVELKRQLENGFHGLSPVLRMGYLFAPTPAIGSKSNQNH